MNTALSIRLAAWSAAVLCVAAALAQNNAPVVSNVTANQRSPDSELVDIHYTLTDADGDACTVTIQASDDAGATWTVPMTAVSGAVRRRRYARLWEANHLEFLGRSAGGVRRPVQGPRLRG